MSCKPGQHETPSSIYNNLINEGIVFGIYIYRVYIRNSKAEWTRALTMSLLGTLSVISRSFPLIIQGLYIKMQHGWAFVRAILIIWQYNANYQLRGDLPTPLTCQLFQLHFWQSLDSNQFRGKSSGACLEYRYSDIKGRSVCLSGMRGF